MKWAISILILFIFFIAGCTNQIINDNVFNTTNEPVLGCPTCSEPTSWSNCSNNRQKRYNYACNETTNYTCQPYIEFQLCQIPEDEKASLYSKTCDELFNLSSEEFDKIDFSCISNSDCNVTYVFACGGCINKNSDVTRYGWIEAALNYKNCITNFPSCKIAAKCRCVNNKCESDSRISLENAKYFACETIELIDGCRLGIETTSITVSDFDANLDGVEDWKDNFQDLCENYYGVEKGNQAACKRLCGC